MLGSLYFSEVKGYLPCDLCWYQRILMYPLSLILAVGLLRQDGNLPFLVLPLSILGQGVATYHYLLEKTTLFGAPAACRSGVPCTVAWINWFGFVTIPFLSMTAFFLVTILCLVALTAGEPDETEDRPAPWRQVGGVIAIVIAGFFLLYQWEDTTAETLTLTELPAGPMQAIPIESPALAVAPESPLASGATSDLVEGERLYQQSCAICHGADAHGLPNLGVSLVDSEIVNGGSDAVVVAIIRDGVTIDDPRNTSGAVMPPSGGRPDLSDDQLLSILHYVRGLE
jgi:disulfide bond formation protein DsbB